jgi:hypothetical protein
VAVAGLRELFFGGAVLAQLGEEREDLLRDHGGAAVAGAGGEVDDAVVLVGFEGAGDVVAEAEAIADALVEARGHAVVEDAEEHLDGGLARVALARGAEGDAELGLAGLVLDEADARALLLEGRRRDALAGAAREATEGLLRGAGARVEVAEVAGDREDGVGRGVVARVVGVEDGLVEAVELIDVAGDREAERVLVVHEGADEVVGVDVAAVVVEVFEDLLAHDAALDLELGEDGLRGDLAEQAEDGLAGCEAGR